MPQLLLLIAGIVGVLIPEQFTYQHTISWVVLAVFIVITVIQVLFFVFAASKVGSARNRRGF